jgi:hypothetical protein
MTTGVGDETQRRMTLESAFCEFSFALLTHVRAIEPPPLALTFEGTSWGYQPSARTAAGNAVTVAIRELGPKLVALPGAQEWVGLALTERLLTLPEVSDINGTRVTDEQPRRDTLVWMELAEIVRVAALEHRTTVLSKADLTSCFARWREVSDQRSRAA